MIKINLLGEECDSKLAWRIGLVCYFLSILCLLAAFYVMYGGIVKDIEVKEQQVATLEAQFEHLKKQTKEIDELEVKDKLLNEKLAVIARVNQNKIGPVRVFDDLNLAVPSHVWLRSVIEKNGFFTIKGRALNNESISIFMKNLDNSDYFSSVELITSDQMYYAKRTGQVQATPDLQALRSDKRATKAGGGKKGTTPAKRWSVREKSRNDIENARKAALDEFNIKIKEFTVTAKVNYAGKLNSVLVKAEKKEEEEI
ncbi:MAG: PilN domain-containing protein [Bdellovibrionota bacterium]|jgi:type IV pilus assembly protein PilN